MKKRKGAALTVVILSLTVLMILILSMANIMRQNLRESVNQDERIQAYYIALAGIELGQAALMKQQGTELFIEQFLADETKKVTHPQDVSQMMDFKDGKIRISIETKKDANGKDWIQIKSEALLESTSTSYTLYKRIDTENIQITVMDRNGI